MEEIIYFELNNWFAGRDYPNNERFIKWMHDDLHISFRNEEWVKENKLCVVYHLVDMSQNFCITATKKWVEENCPELLTEYPQFLRHPEKDGEVYGQFDTHFLEYNEENIGIYEIEDFDW